MSHHHGGRPPVRIEPFPEESIVSMLHRLASAFRMPFRKWVSGTERRFYLPRSPADIQPAAEILGIEVDRLLGHTLYLREPDVTGPLGSPLGGMRDRPALWCRDCGFGTLWTAMTVVSCCGECGELLERLDPDGGCTTVTRAATRPAALDLQASFLAARRNEAIGGDPDYRALERLSETNRLLAHWRRARLFEPDVIHWEGPEPIADFATQAWPASETRQDVEDLIWKTATSGLPSTARPDDDADDTRAELHELLRSADLTAERIPDYVLARTRRMRADLLDEDIGRAIGRALRREAIHAHTGRRPTLKEMCSEFGPILRGELALYDRRLGQTGAGAGWLLREARQLPTDATHTVAERIEMLSHLHHVPASLLAGNPEAARRRRLAAGWIQVELGQVLSDTTSQWSEVISFDSLLAPEDQLALIDFGHEFLNAVTNDVEQAASISAKRQTTVARDAS